ncbi:MAG: 30S ribosomal protein S4 [Lachnospiraceae bacterium]|jgi:small subunit ribosomal protein S4|nr:30S ribosomal protein S4 [Lachnospiraceae bacterium]MCH4031837.1 30S ribosomal protein S4 [Lachnospiraceae bacterium]MCH4070461.1 30S ribosomal protein S4 [Lachnospiraceae bacterium]MCH4109128.1 30S ribosomal protein S4 [Lachnospiraceae bacterium]MCI1302963.1 30S ribosomal protein S4 [Lachnospiraceae bacterium]
MAVERVSILKRCAALGISPAELGITRKSHKRGFNVPEDNTRRRGRGQQARPKKKSEYGEQLTEKQKAKFIYGVLEKPFRNYYEKAERAKGMTGENLMIMLETRLDNVVFRLGLARTRAEARQIIDHRHIYVNGKLVNIPSAAVKAGDVIEVRESKKSCDRYKQILEATNGRLVPEWLTVDTENLKGTVNALPTREQITTPINEMLIVELYSK